MIIADSQGLDALIDWQAENGECRPTVQHELTRLRELVDPDGLHVAAIVHRSDDEHVVRCLWLAKMADSVRPSWFWLSTPADLFERSTQTQTAVTEVAFA